MIANYNDEGELENIAPYKRFGGWIQPYPLHYYGAKKYYTEYKTLERDYEKEKERIIREKGESEFYTDSEFRLKEKDLILLSHNVVLYASMTIEGFINNYGVRRLGERYFKRNIEKIGITEKLQVLLLSCTNYLCKKDEPIVKLTRNIFDLRNALVHPKTKDITVNKDNLNTIQYSEDEIIENLYNFFRLFCNYDQDVKMELEIQKIAL